MLIQYLIQNGIVVEVADLSPSNKKSVIHVLHVDDDPSLQEIAKLMLLDLDSSFEIEHACCVDEAFKKLSTGNYDVVISDYEMPQKSGLQFLEELREQKNKIPFILFTGKGREEVTIQALNLGAEGYYHKQGSPETVYGELAHGIKLATERAKVKSDLEESENRYRTVMEQAAEAIFVHDRNGKIVDVNLQACKSLGYTKEELLAMKVTDISPVAQKTDMGSTWDNVLAGQSLDFESTEKRKDGSLFCVEVCLNSIIVGKETLIIGSVRNIDERKKAEEEQSRLLHDLGERIKELNCIYGTSKILERSDILLEEASLQIVKLFPIAMQYPDITCARIVVDNQEFSTKNFKDTPWKLQTDIKVHGKKVGFVEICYLEERHTVAEGLFLKEELNLIDAIAERLGSNIERKRAEYELRDLVDFNASVINSISEVLLVIDPKDYRILATNGEAEKQLGLREEDLVGKTCYEVTHHSSKPCEAPHSCPLQEALATGKAATANHVHFDKDQNTIYVEISVYPYRNVKGEITKVVHLARNVTERKKIEAELKMAASIFDLATDAICVLDTKGNMVNFNEAACKMYGYSKNEMAKMNLTDLDTPQTAALIESRIKLLFENGSAVFEGVHVRKDKTLLHVEIHARIVDLDGKKHILSVARDISERKKAEVIQRQNMVLKDTDKARISQTKLGEKLNEATTPVYPQHRNL